MSVFSEHNNALIQLKYCTNFEDVKKDGSYTPPYALEWINNKHSSIRVDSRLFFLLVYIALKSTVISVYSSVINRFASE